jgi:hypothetical protein
MNSTMHRVDFAYSRQELNALFRYANEHDVERGGHYDARSAAINVWSHPLAAPGDARRVRGHRDVVFPLGTTIVVGD